MRQFDYLVVGHVCRDLKPDGYAVGGTATYSSLTAHSAGARVGVITSAAPDFEFRRTFLDIEVLCLPSSETTVFENTYVNGARRQMVRAVAAHLSPAAIPSSWRHSQIVHLGPLVQEISADMVAGWGNALVGLTPQGWMREWDDDGHVHACPWRDAEALLLASDVVILSEEDVGGDWSEIEDLARWAKIMVVTSGWQGATVFCQGTVRRFPARHVVEVDPTGAGDIFAAAYMIHLQQTRDPWRSAEFANCVAACSVERAGIASIPTPQEIVACRAERYAAAWRPASQEAMD